MCADEDGTNGGREYGEREWEEEEGGGRKSAVIEYVALLG